MSGNPGGAEDAGVAELLEVARSLGEAFAAAGKRLYLVGGVVRDQVLGRPTGASADLDCTTDAVPTEIKAIVGERAEAVWTQGERFGTIGCTWEGRPYEITTHRAESYAPDSRKPAVAFSTEIEADLSRRDFTVNAMARSLPDGAIIDPYGGRADLASGTLRTPLDPEVSFGDDPLRMLRAARFQAGYGLTPAPELLAAVEAMVERLDIISRERVRDEVVKLLALSDPTAGIEFLVATGLAARSVPELAAVDRVALAALEPDPLTRLALVLHPEGPGGARARLGELRFSNEQVAAVAKTLGAIEELYTADEATAPGVLRRFAWRSGSQRDRAVAVLAAIDADRAEAVVAGLENLAAAEDLTDWAPPLDGESIMALLNLEPGPVIGEATDHLRELRFESGPLTKGDAETALRAWWADRA